MPKMNGKEAVATIRLMRPGIPAAFCTAYSATTSPVNNLDLRTTFIVEKPFDKTNLLQTVRAALDSRYEGDACSEWPQLVSVEHLEQSLQAATAAPARPMSVKSKIEEW